MAFNTVSIIYTMAIVIVLYLSAVTVITVRPWFRCVVTTGFWLSVSCRIGTYFLRVSDDPAYFIIEAISRLDVVFLMLMAGSWLRRESKFNAFHISLASIHVGVLAYFVWLNLPVLPDLSPSVRTIWWVDMVVVALICGVTIKTVFAEWCARRHTEKKNVFALVGLILAVSLLIHRMSLLILVLDGMSRQMYELLTMVIVSVNFLILFVLVVMSVASLMPYSGTGSGRK